MEELILFLGIGQGKSLNQTDAVPVELQNSGLEVQLPLLFNNQLQDKKKTRRGKKTKTNRVFSFLSGLSNCGLTAEDKVWLHQPRGSDVLLNWKMFRRLFAGVGDG